METLCFLYISLESFLFKLKHIGLFGEMNRNMYVIGNNTS